MSIDQNVGELLPAVPVSEIAIPSKWNKRGEFVPADVFELAKDIKDHGLQQPVTVVPFTDPSRPEIKYKLIAGFRRHMASTRVNKSTHITCLLRVGMSPLQETSWNIRENIQRKPLNLAQEANALQDFLDEGYDSRSIALELGMATQWVQLRLDVLKYPPAAQELIAAGLMTQEQIRAGARLPTDKQYEMIRRIRDARLNGDKIEVVAKKNDRANKRKVPTTGQLNKLIDLIFERLQSDGVTFASRCLALAAGNVSWNEFWPDLQKFMQEIDPSVSPGMTAEEFLVDENSIYV